MIAADHEGQRTLGEILLTTLQVASTVANRKQILRLIILDEKLSPGQVWHRIVWQTGAISEHRLQRCVHTYCDYIDLGRLRQITNLSAAGKMDKEIAAEVNCEGFTSPLAAVRSR
ncbi:hypothetical protein [Sinorhizobium meliloti]|uniref:hypothetical protein n=1 Tax=Rhizobium meliloti TaxID=382 RepID=UPI000FD1B56A|nr:hypothetical protein [Sinorhizobium meliloti]RVJ65196.1 hypothetical protein CN171_33730 [Sinorhizobium meliloti]